MEEEKFKDLKENIFAGTGAFIDYKTGDDIQLVVKENNQKPGSPIFVLESGKVGFNTINSIPSDIGDTVRGQIKLDMDTCFFVEVQEIITKAPKEK